MNRERFRQGLEAGMDALEEFRAEGQVVPVEWIDILLRSEADPEDDPDYDAGYRAALDGERLRLIMSNNN